MQTFPTPLPKRIEHRTPGRYLLWLATGHRRALVLAAVFGVTSTLAQALIPAAVGAAVDRGLIVGDRSSLLLWAMVVLGLGVVQAGAGILRDRSSLTVSLGATYRTMQLLTAQASSLGSTLARKVARGEAVTAGTSDATQLGRTLEISAQACGAVAAVVAVAGIMLSVSWQLGLAVLLGVPLMLWTVSLLVRPLHRRQRRLREQQGELTSLAVDIAGGLRVLRGVGGETVYADRYRRTSREVRDAAVRVARVESDIGAVRELLPGLLMVLVVWAGAEFAAAGRISAGQLVVFYAYAVFLTIPLRRLIAAVDQTARGFVAARHVTALLALRPTATDGIRQLPGRGGSVALHDPDSLLSVPPARLTAVVCADPGTADALAERLGGYDGTVTWYGTPLADLSRDTVRRALLVTGDEDLLFSGPLRSVLDPKGRAGADDGPLLRALETAAARDIVEALPDGLDTVIARAGGELSGGQRQRLRLARALVADPEILVLVEPTSAVDAHTEALVGRRLAAHRAGRTTVVLTHSPPLLQQADLVVLLEGATAVLEGTHTELLGDARYRRVVAREDADAV